MQEVPDVPRLKSRASVHLDCLRAIAAFTVLIDHWRNMFYVDFFALHGVRKLALTPLYLVADAAPYAVTVFFVLSGYLISGSLLRAVRKGSFSLPIYGCHRIIRLWMVLIPALLVGGALDVIGIHLPRAHLLYTGHVVNHEQMNVVAGLSVAAFLRTIFFLQPTYGAVFGSNAPLWSVSFEFRYYVLFPLLFVACSSRFSLFWRIGCGAAAIVVGLLTGADPMVLFPLWLAGFAIHFLPGTSVGKPGRVAAAIAFGILFSGVIVLGHKGFSPVAANYIVAVATVALIWVLLGSRGSAGPTLYARLATLFAAFSYSLYTVHFPVLMLLAGLILGSGRWFPTAPHLAIGLVPLAVAMLVAYGLYTLFESRTAAVQKRVEGWVRVRLGHTQMPAVRS